MRKVYLLPFTLHRKASNGQRNLQGGTSVVVPYCYLFLLSVFIFWVTCYVSDIF